MNVSDSTICDFRGHEFLKVGSRRIPCHGGCSSDMPLQPNGTIQIEDFRCRLCGQERSDEVLYSWRKNATTTNKEPN